ncbi:MAG: class I SAM-dependent methyltransferase [Armatimonadetes bacterium]|nr:class I SAM-dependent methyltransferase [Armatimonadota bacterium]
MRCRRCGYVYCNPIPTDEELFSYYDESYVDSEEWERTFRHDRQRVFRNGLRRIGRFAGSSSSSSCDSPKLLDIGCSLGIFLDMARERGFNCFGVEVSRPAAEFAARQPGLHVLTGTLHQAGFDSGFFDVVTLWDVLEHVSDPLSVLQEARRVLKSGGLLVVRVPNVGFHLVRSRIVAQFLPTHDVGLDTLNHLNHFSARSLSRLLSCNGFGMPKILPGSPNLYGKPAIDSAKLLYDALATTARALFRVQIATIIEGYAIKR